MRKVYRLKALEDICYRIQGSYPKEGFFIPKGGSILILGTALSLLTVRKHRSKVNGEFELEAL